MACGVDSWLVWRFGKVALGGWNIVVNMANEVKKVGRLPLNNNAGEDCFTVYYWAVVCFSIFYVTRYWGVL